MKLLFRIFKFEFGLIKKRYYLSIMLLSFIAGYLPIALTAGLFGEDIYTPTGISNSDFSLFKLSSRFIYLLAFLIAAFGSEIFNRERKNKFDQLFYSYPLKHITVFIAKLCLISGVIFAFIFSFFLGTVVPVFQADVNLHYIIYPCLDIYLLLFIAYLLPAAVFITSLTSLTALNRKEYYAPVVVIIILFILQQALGIFYTAVPEGLISAFADLFGNLSLNLHISSFSTNELDTAQLIVPDGYLLPRIIYSVLSLVPLFFAYQRFCSPVFGGRKERYNLSNQSGHLSRYHKMFLDHISAYLQRVKVLSELIALWKISGISFHSIIKEKTFIWVSAAGFGLIGLILTGANLPHNIQLQPATWIMLAYPMFFFSLFIKVLTIFYTAVVLHRNRNNGLLELIDSTPLSNLKTAAANLATLVRIQLLLMFILFFIMLGFQLYGGSEHIDISLYFVSFITIHLPDYIVFLILSYFIQTIFNSFYPGMFISFGFMFLLMQLEALGIQSNLLRFNLPPHPYFYLNYSELSGFGRDLIPYYIYKFYWLLFAGILFFLTVMIHPRGLNSGMVRFSGILKQPLKRSVLLIFSAVCISFFGMLFFIKHEEQKVINIGNGVSKTVFNSNVDAETNIKHSPSPRIISKDITIDIFPEENSFRAAGKYIAVNKSSIPLKWIVLRQSELTEASYQFNNHAELYFKDSLGKYALYKLAEPLHPADSVTIEFSLTHSPKGILDRNTLVQSNGTYITSEIFPTLGFRHDSPVSSNKSNQSPVNHYRAADADFISLSLKVSTTENQIALAPGYLVDRYKTNGRSFSHFIFPEQVTPEFAVLSGEYAVYTEVHENDTLQLYYHPGHYQNIAHIMKGLRASRDLYTGLFRKSLHSVLRLAEFSRQYGHYAQAYNTLIAYSESGFILDANGNPAQSINLPFLGAAHEMAHLWWGTRVVPADAPGYKLITESIAEYLAYKVYEMQFGKKAAQLIREKAMSNYMKKSLEAEDEKPLSLVLHASDNFIAYQKGLIIFCILEDMLGENKLMDILSGFFARYSSGNANYPFAKDLIDFILQNSPSWHQVHIKSLFTTVWHQSISVNEVSCLLRGSVFQTVIQSEFSTLQKNEFNQFLPDNSLNNSVEIGFYNNENEIPRDTIITVKLLPGKNKISIKTGFRPERIVIDPRYKCLFRIRSKLVHRV